jgi:nucleotide-binding universal stress UspA family protein
MQRILVALDGSEHSDKALDLAIDIAGKYGAELVLLHVMSDKQLTDGERYLAETEYVDDLLASLEAPVMSSGDSRQRAERVLRYYSDVARRFCQAIGDQLMSRARDRAREKGVQQMQTVLEEGDPANTILQVAKRRQADMIFLGSRGLSDAKGLLLGSVSHKVAHLAECTCVTVK